MRFLKSLFLNCNLSNSSKHKGKYAKPQNAIPGSQSTWRVYSLRWDWNASLSTSTVPALPVLMAGLEGEPSQLWPCSKTACISTEDLPLLCFLKLQWMMRPLNPILLTLIFSRGDYSVCEDEKMCDQRGTEAARIQACQVWWLTPLLSAPRRLRQKFKASLAYIVSVGLAWTTHETLPPKQ